MSQPLAADKYNDLVESLNAMRKNTSLVNEFELKRIERDANNLSSVEKRYVVLGMIACIRNDMDNMHYCHKNAIRLSQDINIKWQYYVSLCSAGLYQEAFDLCMGMKADYPMDESVVIELMLMSGKLGNDDAYQKYLAEYEGMLTSDELKSEETQRVLFIYRHRLLDAVNNACRLAGESFSSIKHLDLSFDQDDNCMAIDLVVDSDVDQFLDEYSKYTYKLIETVPVDKLEYMYLNYSFA